MELVGAGCSNQMQVAYGQVLIGVSALVQAAVDCCIDLAPTSSEDGPDPLQFAKVVIFSSSTNAVLWWRNLVRLERE